MILKNKLGEIILFTTILGVGSYFVPLPNNGIIKSEIVAEAAQSKFTHNHGAYTFYKITSYMPYSAAKKMVAQGKQTKSISNLLAIAGGTYRNWAGGLIKV